MGEEMSLTLIDCIKNAQWLQILSSNSSLLNEASKIDPKTNSLSLHWACSNINGKALSAPLAAIKLIYKAYPKAAYHQDKHGLTPIHCCLLHDIKQKEEIITYFLSECPNAFSIPNSYHEYPLHVAIYSKYLPSIELVQAIIDVYPKAVRKGSVCEYMRACGLCSAVRSTLYDLSIDTTFSEVGANVPINFFGKNISFSYSFKVASLLLKQSFLNIHEDSSSKTTLLEASIQCSMCSWTWCSLTALLYPEQCISSDILPLALINSNKNEHYKNESKMREDCEKMTFIYRVIREHPSVYANVALQNLNKN